ncbi:MAG: phenylalanine--tRNA ligase subunit beta, partial [Bacillota bacterium]|nr:phenylalanine--tRNA ligase subunit beta [Bacillota bacterium]
GSVACELDFDQIIRLDRETVKRYEGLPRYPSVERDLAFVIQAAVPVQDVVTLIQKGGGPLLQEVNLFDVYQGKQVGEGYRSLAFALRFQAPDRTLTDDAVNGYLEAIVQLLTEHTGATLRK